MDQTLQQLGELLLGAVPTVILLALLYLLYTAIVHKPLRRVLEDRRSKTEGAVEKSRADITAAEARTSEYEQRLREARATVFRAQEARRKAALDARTAALNEARNQAHKQVQAAKADIQKDRDAAQGGLQAEAQRRENQQAIVAVLERNVPTPTPVLVLEHGQVRLPEQPGQLNHHLGFPVPRVSDLLVHIRLKLIEVKAVPHG